MSEKRTSLSHWIFVINDADKEFERRVQKKEWPIFSFTTNRNRIRPDDKVIFYKAGVGGQKFLGSATVTSELKKEEDSIDFFVTLSNIKLWKKGIDIHPLVSKLDFIVSKEMWGRHFQGGVRAINSRDFQTVLKN